MSRSPKAEVRGPLLRRGAPGLALQFGSLTHDHVTQRDQSLQLFALDVYKRQAYAMPNAATAASDFVPTTS